MHSGVMCEKKIRKRIAQYDPDVVISVHPAMNNVPRVSTKRLSKEHGKHIPFFTVVTDLGSGHSMWFERQVEKVYVASERIRKLARRRGLLPSDKIVMTGLPIRHDFAVQAENMGDRTMDSGKDYQTEIREQLDLDTDKRMVLVMGGGEGVGSLSEIVDQLYVKFTKQGVNATICVVCGRNEKLMNDLTGRDWDAVMAQSQEPKKKRRFRSAHRSKEIQAALDLAEETKGSDKKGDVVVRGLGYVNGMADYMVAADVLVSKAGPGTIAEAAALGLPVMMTRYVLSREVLNCALLPGVSSDRRLSLFTVTYLVKKLEMLMLFWMRDLGTTAKTPMKLPAKSLAG
jgi:1,2-diacylglycerol 3-beta-galactosyltransferase